MTPRIRVRGGRVRGPPGPQPVLAGGQPAKPARKAAQETVTAPETAWETVAWPEGRMYAHRTP